jgi:hypothetical protein
MQSVPEAASAVPRERAVTSPTTSKQCIEEACDRNPPAPTCPTQSTALTTSSPKSTTGSGAGYSDEAAGSPDIVYAVHACRAKARCQADCFGDAHRTF